MEKGTEQNAREESSILMAYVCVARPEIDARWIRVLESMHMF
jgi:hypothetical protein